MIYAVHDFEVILERGVTFGPTVSFLFSLLTSQHVSLELNLPGTYLWPGYLMSISSAVSDRDT